jgi:hypothetical protein
MAEDRTPRRHEPDQVAGPSRALTPSLTSKSWEIGARRPAAPDDFLAPQRRSGPSGQLSPKLPLSEGHRR